MPLLPESEIKIKLSDMNDDARRCQLGELVIGTEISGTLEVSGFSNGDKVKAYVEHTTEFLDNPLPSFGEAAGFTVTPVLDGTDGTQFSVYVEYASSEYIYGYDGSLVPGGGSASLAWTRRGIAIKEP